MGEVLYCIFTPKTTDGGKARFKRRREAVFRLDDSALVDASRCDLSMGRADTVEMPADSAP